MKDNKILIYLGILVLIVLIFICGIVIYKDMKEEKKGTEEKIYKVYDINDSLVQKLLKPVDIIPMLDDEDLLPKLYGDSKTVNVADLTDNQKLYLSLRYYMTSNNILVDACGEGKTYEVKSADLKSSYVKDNGYLEKIEKSQEEVKVGEYSYVTTDDGFNVCHSIYGFEGPKRVTHDLEVVSAYRDDNKMYINAKIIRYVSNSNKAENPENFYYETHDSYSDNSPIIEGFEESLDGSFFEPDLNKYATYSFVYEIDGDNYYLESISKK